MKVLTLILTFSIIAVFSQATPTLITLDKVQINQSSMLNSVEREGGKKCNYKITIETSCASPPSTTDEIDVLFGDVYGSEVYVPRLNGRASGTFDQCRTTTFDIRGKPCIDSICKLYVYRRGSNGWVPKTVTAYDYVDPPFVFYINLYIPNDGAGYGHDFCPRRHF